MVGGRGGRGRENTMLRLTMARVVAEPTDTTLMTVERT